MPSIADLRAMYPDAKDASDEQIVSWVAQRTGQDVQSAAKFLGLTPGKERSAIGAGLRSGYEDTKGLMYSTGAALSNVVGAKSVENWANNQASDREIASNIASRPDLERIEDQSLGSAIPYSAYQIAKQATNAVGAIGTGVIAPEAAIPGAIARGAAYLPRAVAGGSLAAAETFAEKKAALAAGRTLAKQVAGGAVYNETNAIGSLYQNAKDNPDDTHPGLTALAGSVPYALAETVPEAMLGGRFMHGSGFEGNFLKRAGKSAAIQAPSGAASELLQTKMELAVGKPVSDEEAQSQYLNAGVAGGLVEGLMGLSGGLHGAKPNATNTSSMLNNSNKAVNTSVNPPGNFQTENKQPNTGDSVQQALNQTNLGATPTQGIQVTSQPNTAASLTAANPTAAATAQGTTPLAQNVQAAQQQQAQQDAVAQQQQAAAQAAAQAAEAQKQQVSGALQAYGVAPNVDSTQGNFFGKPLFGQSVSYFGTVLAQEASSIPANQQPITQAIAQANTAVGGKMIQFKFDATNPAKTVAAAFAGIAKVALKYQLHSANTPEEAADRLNIISKTSKGIELEHVNAIHQALTGKDTSGYIESQQSKGEKNGNKQPQRQVETTPGVGTVSVQGGSAQTANGGGNVGNGNVQPIGTGSVSQGTPSQQTGSNAGEGIRNSTDSNLLQRNDNNAGNGAGQGQVNQLLQGNSNEIQNSVGGQQGSQSQQTSQPAVDQQNVPISTPTYYSSDLSHIPSARRIEIISELLAQALAPLTKRSNAVDAKTRVELVRLSLVEQHTREASAKVTGLNIATVEKQLERLGIKLDPKIDEYVVTDPTLAKTIVKKAEEYKSEEFPDGIGEQQLKSLYATRYETTDEPQSLSEELEGGNQEGDRSKLLSEEIHGTGEENEGQSMGTIGTAGGSQGAVESLAKASFDKIEKLTKDLNALPEKDPRRKALEEKIKDEWSNYGKKQAAWDKNSGVVLTNNEEGEEENAVQEQSTDEGNVRKSTGGSKTVGKGNTQPKKSTKQSSTEKTSQKPSEPKKVEPTVIKTDTELAEESWNKVADTIPGAPKFAELSKDQRETFIDYGKDNWTPSDVRAELVNGEATKATDISRRSVNPVTKTITTTVPNVNKSLQTRVVVGKEEKVNFLKNPRSVTLLDEDNIAFVADEKSLPELDQKYPGIAKALTHYENRGMSHILEAVEAWYVTDDEVSWDAAFTQINGQNAIVFRVGNLHNTAETEWATHHELGHAIDDIGSGVGGIFSSRPEFNVSVKNNKIIPMGSIIKEVYEHYLAEPNSELSKHLVYPFDRKQNSDLNGDGVREELFAQLWASYNTPLGRDFLEDSLPNVAAFMGEVNDTVEKIKYGNAKTSVGKTKVNPIITQKAGNIESGQIQRSQIAVRLRENRTQERIEKTIDGLPPNLQKPTKVIVNGLVSQLHNKFGAVKDIVLKSAITEDIVKFATKHMPSAARYLTSQYARQADVAQWNNRIDKILTAHDALEGEEKGTGTNSVNKFIEDSVMLGKWGYMPEEHRIGTTLIYDLIDDDLSKRFVKFSTEAQKVIKDYFEHGYQTLTAKQAAAKEAVNREFAEAERLAFGIPNDEAQVAVDKKAAMSKIVELDPSVPYGHLARYGNYLVVAKSAEYQAYEDILKGESAAPIGVHGVVGTANSAKIWMDENQSNPTHYVVQFADTIGEAKAIANNLAATGHYDHVEASPKETEASYTGGSDMHLAVARLRNLMKRQTEDKGSPEYKALDDMIGNLYLMTVAQNSAKKFTLQQKKIAGYDSNMMRNLATSGRADAHFLATMKHNDDINSSIDKMREEARRNRGEAMPYFNELINRHTQSMDYKTPSVLAKTLNQMNHIWSLTFSPAFYVQQMLQTGAISLPYMAGRLGYANAARHIGRAYEDIAKIKSVFEFKDVNNHVDFSKAPTDVRNMLERLVGMGKIDIGMDSEFKARSHEQNMFDKVMYKMQGITNRIEAVNRSVAAIAAYRGYLERYGNTNTEAAIQYASDVVSDTHGSYDGLNTPRALKGVTGQIIGQFRRFQIIQLSMLGKLIHSSFNNASKEEQMVARKTLAFIAAQMAVVSGALGVPFISQLMFLTLKMFGSPDEPDDPEYKLRKLIGNPVAADLLLRGVTGAVGWESLGKKLSMENVASPFGGYVVPDLTSRTGVEQTALAILGPSLNLAEKFADAFQLITHGNYYKGVEMAMPNGIANVLKGVRFSVEGMTMRNGDLVMKPNDIGVLTAASQLVGLPTNQITHQQFAQKVKAEYDKQYETRLADIKSEYVQAARSNDYKAMSNAREEFKNMEESRVANGYKRQPLSELLKAPMAAKKRENSVVNGVESSKQNKKFLQTIGG